MAEVREFPAGRQPRNGIGLNHDLVAVENDDVEGIRHMTIFGRSAFRRLARRTCTHQHVRFFFLCVGWRITHEEDYMRHIGCRGGNRRIR